jgi:hypothetical protein
MIDMRGISTLIIMGLGAVVAVGVLGIIALIGIFVAIPGWVYFAAAAVCLVVSFAIGQRLE